MTVAEYPNLEMLSRGCVSGQISEWPLLKAEAKQILADLKAAREELDALKRHMKREAKATTEADEQQRAENERLRKALENAPHAYGCPAIVRYDHILQKWIPAGGCDCWKSRALNPQESQPHTREAI